MTALRRLHTSSCAYPVKLAAYLAAFCRKRYTLTVYKTYEKVGFLWQQLAQPILKMAWA